MVLFEFKHTEVFTSHGGYLLNTKLFKDLQRSWCRIFSSRSRSREFDFKIFCLLLSQ